MEKSTFTVLITGANSGLGFSICCRLIDEFLYSRPQSHSLHLLFSTRTPRKSAETLTRLNAHLQKTLRTANTHEAPGLSKLIEARYRIEGVQCDLTKLLTVKALSEDLLRRRETLDVVIWNAGIAGWKGRNWFKAIWDVTTKCVEACTYPEYNIADVGLLADRQGRSVTQQQGAKAAGPAMADDEPKLGQVFLANVFGHYMLTHWLAPLLTPDSRIVWVSSVSAVAETFQVDDMQGLRSLTAYEGSKRLTDLLVLASERPSTQPYVRSFLPSSPARPQTGDATTPKMLLTHPGVIATSIAGLNWIMTSLMLLTFYICRLLGSPWHPVDAYKGSVSAVFAALAPPDQLLEYEARDGKGKWGSATSVFGDERVARTEVEGWGFCGVVGKMVAGAVSTGNKTGGVLGGYSKYRKTDKETREQFEVDATVCWREMEALRVEWEKRLGPVRFQENEDV